MAKLYSQLNYIEFDRIKIDLFDGRKFCLRQSAAFHVQRIDIVVNVPAHTFVRASGHILTIVLITIDYTDTGTDQQKDYETMLVHYALPRSTHIELKFFLRIFLSIVIAFELLRT